LNAIAVGRVSAFSLARSAVNEMLGPMQEVNACRYQWPPAGHVLTLAGRATEALYALNMQVVALQLWRFEALRRVPILYNLSEAQLMQLAKCMMPRSLAAGEVVFHKGDTGECCGVHPCARRMSKVNPLHTAAHWRCAT
jgi:hypothetical protein